MPVIAELLAEYFVVAVEQTASWVSKDKGKDVEVKLPFVFSSQIEILKSWLLDQCREKKLSEISNIDIRTDIPIFHTNQPPLPNVKNIIAIASGKGGVGKSATTVNLAYALRKEGARVGILDADIYGPSIPMMLGNLSSHATSSDNRSMLPQSAYGVVANSIGYLVPAENATVWRGPMASRALHQLLNDTQWPVLDYLLVDMPPGTGDIQLTMAQQVPLTAAVVVTTPQDLALADATKAIAMFEKVDVPVLGLIENMSYYQCEHCGATSHLFSEKGGDKLAKKHHLPVLGHMPLDIAIREHADSGDPLIVSKPDSPLSIAYLEAARMLSQQLGLTTPLYHADTRDRANQIDIKQL